MLNEIFNEIPDDFEHKEHLSLLLGSVSNSYLYSPPERRLYWWSQAAMDLTRYLGDPVEEWQERVATIFNDGRPEVDWKKEGF